MDNGRVTDTACTIIALLLVLAVCKFAQSVLEPAAFAIFIIAIVLPMQKALARRIGKAAAGVITLVATAAVILMLLSVIVWEVREIVDWVSRNIDRIEDSIIA